jgi:DNA-binding beta-propeller fold protein YncE
VEAPGGWSAPPQSVAVAPDESIALVASSARIDPTDPTRTVTNNVLSVIDLRAMPPRVIDTLQTGRRAAGVSINPEGTLALVANRGDGTLSVFAISGTRVTPVSTVDLDAPDSEPSLPVFSPDGRTAYVTRNNDHRISILSVDGQAVAYTGRDISANLRPYSMELTPSGTVAIVGNIGNGPTGGADTISVIDLEATPPRLVEAITVGLIPEGVAMSPDGQHVAVTVMNGSNLARTSPFANDFGLLKVFRLNGTTLAQVAEARIGHWCQGVVWDRPGQTLLVQCAADREILVFNFDGRALTRTTALPVSGAPTGIRTAVTR